MSRTKKKQINTSFVIAFLIMALVLGFFVFGIKLQTIQAGAGGFILTGDLPDKVPAGSEVIIKGQIGYQGEGAGLKQCFIPLRIVEYPALDHEIYLEYKKATRTYSVQPITTTKATTNIVVYKPIDYYLTITKRATNPKTTVAIISTKTTQIVSALAVTTKITTQENQLAGISWFKTAVPFEIKGDSVVFYYAGKELLDDCKFVVNKHGVSKLFNEKVKYVRMYIMDYENQGKKIYFPTGSDFLTAITEGGKKPFAEVKSMVGYELRLSPSFYENALLQAVIEGKIFYAIYKGVWHYDPRTDPPEYKKYDGKKIYDIWCDQFSARTNTFSIITDYLDVDTVAIPKEVNVDEGKIPIKLVIRNPSMIKNNYKVSIQLIGEQVAKGTISFQQTITLDKQSSKEISVALDFAGAGKKTVKVDVETIKQTYRFEEGSYHNTFEVNVKGYAEYLKEFPRKYKLEIYVKDKATGKPLEGAKVYVSKKLIGLTDKNGYISTILPSSSLYEVIVYGPDKDPDTGQASHYVTQWKYISLDKDTTLTFELEARFTVTDVEGNKYLYTKQPDGSFKNQGQIGVEQKQNEYYKNVLVPKVEELLNNTKSLSDNVQGETTNAEFKKEDKPVLEDKIKDFYVDENDKVQPIYEQQVKTEKALKVEEVKGGGVKGLTLDLGMILIFLVIGLLFFGIIFMVIKIMKVRGRTR